jgi:hypothetical protein
MDKSPLPALCLRATSREPTDNSSSGKSFRHQCSETTLRNITNLPGPRGNVGRPYFGVQALCEIFHDFICAVDSHGFIPLLLT